MREKPFAAVQSAPQFLCMRGCEEITQHPWDHAGTWQSLWPLSEAKILIWDKRAAVLHLDPARSDRTHLTSPWGIAGGLFLASQVKLVFQMVKMWLTAGHESGDQNQFDHVLAVLVTWPHHVGVMNVWATFYGIHLLRFFSWGATKWLTLPILESCHR